MRNLDLITRGKKAALLLAGDLAMLLLFVYIGQRDHELIDANSPVLGLLLPTAIFAIPWFVSGILLGSYDTDTIPRSFLARSLNTWLVAAPLAVWLRALVLGRAVVPTSFISAALGFGGLMILGWRLVFALAFVRLQERQPGWVWR
jgi:hypothetical protein